MIQHEGKCFEWSEVKGLFIVLENNIKKEKKRRKPIPLCLKQRNIIKHVAADIDLDSSNKSLHPDYFSSVKQILKEMMMCKPESYIQMRSSSQVWAKSLSKLAKIPLEEACLIAETRVENKRAKLASLKEKQDKSFSILRSHVIAKLERKKALRTIKNKESAEAMVQAHKQHIEARSRLKKNP